MDLTIFILASSGVIILFAELTTRIVCGRLINDDELTRAIEREIPNGVKYNSFNATIFNVGRINGFITTVPGLRIISKFYIYGQGTIPRWGKSHKILNNIYKNRPSKNLTY